MNVFKNILSLLFIFIGLFSQVEAKAIIIENEKVKLFSKHNLEEQAKEIEWLGLLYLKEEIAYQNKYSYYCFSPSSLVQTYLGELFPKKVTQNFLTDFQIAKMSTSHRENDGWGKNIFYWNAGWVESWKKVDELKDIAFKDLKKDPDFLKKFDDVANDADLNKHIFNGEPQLDGDLIRGVSGVHSNKNLVPSSQTTGLSRGDLRIQPDTKVELGNGYYEAKVQVYGDKGAPGGTYVDDWVKGKKSTFFPDNWSPEKIQAEIANGIKNKIPDPDFPTSNGNTAFKVTMTDGTKLQMVYDGDKLISAFPNLR